MGWSKRKIGDIYKPARPWKENRTTCNLTKMSWSQYIPGPIIYNAKLPLYDAYANQHSSNSSKIKEKRCRKLDWSMPVYQSRFSKNDKGFQRAPGAEYYEKRLWYPDSDQKRSHNLSTIPESNRRQRKSVSSDIPILNPKDLYQCSLKEGMEAIKLRLKKKQAAERPNAMEPWQLPEVIALQDWFMKTNH